MASVKTDISNDINKKDICKDLLGKYVIIRTYSAGVHAGFLSEKSGNEVILKDSRRLWRWKCNKGISLSDLSVYGIDASNSRIATKIDLLWLEAIEIIPVTEICFKTISEAPIAEAE